MDKKHNIDNDVAMKSDADRSKDLGDGTVLNKAEGRQVKVYQTPQVCCLGELKNLIMGLSGGTGDSIGLNEDF